jgi:hypothetical protein
MDDDKPPKYPEMRKVQTPEGETWETRIKLSDYLPKLPEGSTLLSMTTPDGKTYCTDKGLEALKPESDKEQ